MGMFDDLIPQGASPPARGGLFDDLVPSQAAPEGPKVSEADMLDARKKVGGIGGVGLFRCSKLLRCATSVS